MAACDHGFVKWTVLLLVAVAFAGCAEDQTAPGEPAPQTTTPPSTTQAPAPEPETAPEPHGTPCSLRSESLQSSQRVRMWNCSQPGGNFNGELDECDGFTTRELRLSGRVEGGTLRVRVYGDDLQVDRTLNQGDSGSTQPIPLDGAAWTVSMERDADFDAGPGFNIGLFCYR